MGEWKGSDHTQLCAFQLHGGFSFTDRIFLFVILEAPLISTLYSLCPFSSVSLFYSQFRSLFFFFKRLTAYNLLLVTLRSGLSRRVVPHFPSPSPRPGSATSSVGSSARGPLGSWRPELKVGPLGDLGMHWPMREGGHHLTRTTRVTRIMA